MRTIIFYKTHFTDFYQRQNEKAKGKIQYVLEIVKQVDRVPKKFMEHMTGTDGLYEIRVEFQSNIYRIFCCFDEEQLVVLFNGFQKKHRKHQKLKLKKPNG